MRAVNISEIFMTFMRLNCTHRFDKIYVIFCGQNECWMNALLQERNWLIAGGETSGRAVVASSWCSGLSRSSGVSRGSRWSRWSSLSRLSWWSGISGLSILSGSSGGSSWGIWSRNELSWLSRASSLSGSFIQFTWCPHYDMVNLRSHMRGNTLIKCKSLEENQEEILNQSFQLFHLSSFF